MDTQNGKPVQRRATDSETEQHAKEWTAFIARTGYFTKGIFYTILGSIALDTGLKAGRSNVNIQTALVVVLDQPFGQALLGLMILGLIGYSLWRIAQGIFDLDLKGKETTDLILRASYLISGASYAVSAYSGVKLLLGQSSSQATGNLKQAIDFVYQLPLGPEMVGLVGFVLVIVSFFQFYQAVTANFKEHIDLGKTSEITEAALFFVGRVGYAARGVLYMLIGYSMIRAAVTQHPNIAGGFGHAFKILDSISQSPWILIVTSIGIILYGCYTILLTRFREFLFD